MVTITQSDVNNVTAKRLHFAGGPCILSIQTVSGGGVIVNSSDEAAELQLAFEPATDHVTMRACKY